MPPRLDDADDWAWRWYHEWRMSGTSRTTQIWSDFLATISTLLRIGDDNWSKPRDPWYEPPLDGLAADVLAMMMMMVVVGVSTQCAQTILK